MKHTSRHEYQERPILQIHLNTTGTSNFRVGVRKAKAIVRAMKEIEEFVKEYPDED